MHDVSSAIGAEAVGAPRGLARFLAEHERCPGEIAVGGEPGVSTIRCRGCGQSFDRPAADDFDDGHDLDAALAALAGGAEQPTSKPPRLPPPGPLGFRRRRSLSSQLRSAAESVARATIGIVTRRRWALLGTISALAAAVLIALGGTDEVPSEDATGAPVDSAAVTVEGGGAAAAPGLSPPRPERAPGAALPPPREPRR